jgi:murein hydrolase activator
VNNKKLFRTCWFCCLLLLNAVFADSLEEYDRKIQENTQRIKALEKQISSLRSEMSKYQQQEKGILSELDNTERQISLTNEKIRLQNRELALRRGRLTELRKDYAQAEDEGEKLIRRYEKRIVHAYKLRPARQWDLLVDAASPRELYYRVKYISAVNRADRQLYQSIRSNMKLISRRSSQIEEEVSSIRKNLASLDNEKRSLSKLKNEQQRQYQRIQSDKVLLAEQLKEKEASKKAIETIIEKAQEDRDAYLARLEEERKKRKLVEAPFSDKKGTLPWPVNGTIVREFGNQKHPVLGTITENSGIDIKSARGNPVRVVSDGMVVTVTWLRGYGNTIIVIHDNSYYSVYSHVENIDVIQGEYVDSGQQLASVSSDISMDVAILHFELWQGQEKLNPRSWLR